MKITLSHWQFLITTSYISLKHKMKIQLFEKAFLFSEQNLVNKTKYEKS